MASIKSYSGCSIHGLGWSQSKKPLPSLSHAEVLGSWGFKPRSSRNYIGGIPDKSVLYDIYVNKGLEDSVK